MKIRINLKIFIFVIIFLITGQLKIYGILMLFSLIHELGHLLAGIFMKFKPEAMKIMPMGLSISFNIPVKDYNKKFWNSNIIKIKKIVIALAGPLTNIVIFIILNFVNLGINEENRILCEYANLLIAVFNLLPIYPLDGGRILKGIMSLKLSKINLIKNVNRISNATLLILTVISSIAIYYYKNIAILFIIVYLWILTIMQNKKDNMKMQIYRTIEKIKLD